MAKVLVTGSTSGLGELTVASLAARGHEVVAHARRADAVVEGASAHVHGDLADLSALKDLARQANELGPFDAVIHNAGTMDAGLVVPVNVVAPYVLTALMERPERIIVLSSSMHAGGSTAHMRAAILDDGAASYSDAKLWETILAVALSRRWPSTHVHAVVPGWVPTRMGGPSAPDDLEQGHHTQEWLANAPIESIDPATAGHWHHMRTQRPHGAVLDLSLHDELLSALAERTGIELPN